MGFDDSLWKRTRLFEFDMNYADRNTTQFAPHPYTWEASPFWIHYPVI